MANRPSVQEILEAARRGGAAKPGDGGPAAPPPEVTEPVAEPPATARAVPTPPADVPTPQSLGRPLTLKEKLAAARAGGSAAAAPAAASTPAAAPEGAAPAGGAEPVKQVPPPAPSLGRPMTLQEKLAAARGGAAPAGGAGAAKPAATKPTTPAAKPAAARRELPPLAEITEPKDLAEALRQAGEQKEKQLAAARAPAAVATKPAKKEARPQTVLPRPSRAAAFSSAVAVSRRTLMSVTGLVIVGWVAFTLGLIQFTAMLGRFMFPNVLAEPPSTVKIGLPTDFEPETVNERFKAEWGFWVVRSALFNGQDIIYALQSVCTHLGCPPNWLAGEQKFKCPCHGSGYYISGVNFEGPAPRPLERFKVALGDDGQIIVDKSQKFQEELDQWTDPDSFVTA